MTLQQWMDARGKNDAALATDLGSLSRSQISRIRRFGTTSLPTAQLLANHTKLPVSAFSREAVRSEAA